MKIKHQELKIPQDNPFTNCKLVREPYARVLTDIVKIYADGFVLAINNEWGAGKTTFVKMWQQQLKNEDYQTIYFNAWENDFDNNAFVAITSELKSLIDSNDERFKTLLQKGGAITKKLVPSIIKNIIKQYTGTDFKEIVDTATETGFDIFNQQIDEYANRKKSIKEFKDDLTKFLKEFTPEKPLIFIVDELDRCRPDYAVEVLENIKHLFSVPGIVFVLSIDKVQLGNAICGYYGSDKINADEYLRRFIDVEYSIPEPNYEKFVWYLSNKFGIQKLFENTSLAGNKYYSEDIAQLFKITTFLFTRLSYNLRQQEKIFIHLAVILKTFTNNSPLIPHLLMYLICLKTSNKVFYNKIQSKSLTINELLKENKNFLTLVSAPKQNEINTASTIEALLIVFYFRYVSKLNEKFDSGNYQSQYDLNTDNFIKLLDSWVENDRTYSLNITYLFEKIDLVDNFKS